MGMFLHVMCVYASLPQRCQSRPALRPPAGDRHAAAGRPATGQPGAVAEVRPLRGAEGGPDRLQRQLCHGVPGVPRGARQAPGPGQAGAQGRGRQEIHVEACMEHATAGGVLGRFSEWLAGFAPRPRRWAKNDQCIYMTNVYIYDQCMYIFYIHMYIHI